MPVITTYYLEMSNSAQLCYARAAVPELEIRQARIPSPELSRFLYTAVGGDWFWINRLNWNYAHWLTYLNRPELETWVAYLQGTPAGYIELELQEAANVEVAYFGLLPQFVGRGIGGVLLSHGVERAWQMGARRVWVHTCTLDSPAALANYQARGFRIYKEEREEQSLPSETPGPWPGAGPR